MSLPLLYTALSATMLSADPPAPVPAADELPAPRSVLVEPAFPGYYRRSAYDRWQLYSVAQNDMGWRPRVAYAPGYGYGYYYVYNGKPYWYAPNYQRWYSPSIMGTPYRSFEPMPPVMIIEEELLPAPAVKPEEKPVEEEKPAEAKPAEVKPTSTKKKKAPAKEPERMPHEDE
jgi:hypothetical protein